jgi:phosphonate transport system substrate-binding protein
MKVFFAVLGMSVLGLALLGSCSRGSKASPGSTANSAAEPRANWPGKITIVQMPIENYPDAGSKNEKFRSGLEARLGRTVEELEAFEYAVGIEAMRAGKLDILLVSPMSYYHAKRFVAVEPLVTTAVMGAVPYKTVFITKIGRSDINSIEDLRGKTFAFVDPASSSGFMYPKAHLITRLGLDPDLLEQPGYFFKTVAYSGKHDFSVVGVDMEDYDAAAVALQIIGQMHDAGAVNRDNIKIVGETEVIPSACYVIRPDLPQDLKDEILDYYLSYDDPEFFRTFYQSPDMRFTRAYDSDYAVVDDMARILKIEG